MLDEEMSMGENPLVAPPRLFWASGLRVSRFSALGAYLHEKIILEKSQVHVTPFRSLKVKNNQNRVLISCIVINQIKGIICKSPKINVKHGYNIV
jgi:hypothetical protein